MLKALVVLCVVGQCLGQLIARQKCDEYIARAKTQKNAPMCHALSDNRTGVMVEPDEFPATAMLGYVTPSGEILYLCDATLISDDTLLAAGHCLQQKKYGRPKWARLGATHSTLGTEVEVKESLCHPSYHPGNDIALVKLKEKLDTTHHPACLDTRGPAEGEKGVGIGRPIGSVYTQLRSKCPIKSVLEIQRSQECAETFPRQNISSEATLCIRDPTSGPGDCLSGPLYVSREPCIHTVVGLASFGKACISETPTGRTPSVYTKVSHYVPWIESLTWPSDDSSKA